MPGAHRGPARPRAGRSPRAPAPAGGAVAGAARAAAAAAAQAAAAGPPAAGLTCIDAASLAVARCPGKFGIANFLRPRYEPVKRMSRHTYVTI